jgi:DNA-binding NarL/FixJ family response regulator
MDGSRRILLVSPDLMSTSRITGLARSIDAVVETLRSLEGIPQAAPFAVVLVDLQALAGDAATVVSRVREIVEALPGQVGVPFRVVAFGPHVQKQRLDDAAAAGADAAVSRGELLGGFAGLMTRWMA